LSLASAGLASACFCKGHICAPLAPLPPPHGSLAVTVIIAGTARAVGGGGDTIDGRLAGEAAQHCQLASRPSVLPHRTNLSHDPSIGPRTSFALACLSRCTEGLAPNEATRAWGTEMLLRDCRIYGPAWQNVTRPGILREGGNRYYLERHDS
jgi:hypothetical protein